MTDQTVKPGQIWRDNDPRARGRLIHVVEVGETHARCTSYGRNVRIRLDRFKPTSTGYVLHQEAQK